MMKKSDVTSIYSMEDLLPIVGRLTEAYTSKESSSITYEKARQFMDAVIYCIAHCEEENVLRESGKDDKKCEKESIKDDKENDTEARQKIVLINSSVLSATEAYELGYQTVVEKVRQTIDEYNELMLYFDHYENINYRDTVEKALPGFFMYYDAKYAPMEHIITMDYPIFGLDMELEGIDRIRQYLDAIITEQQYLMQFDRERIIEKLRSFHPQYEKEYFNLKEICK